MKIKAIHQLLLRNEEHYQFMLDVLSIAKVAGEGFQAVAGVIVTQLITLVEREDAALEPIRKSNLTVPLHELDELRDSYFQGLRMMIGAYLHSPNPEQVEMAMRVQTILDHYGNISVKNYVEETGTMYNMVQELSHRTLGEMQQLHAEPFFHAMALVNQDFDALMNKRYNESAKQEYENVKAVRKLADATYHQLTATVDAAVIINGETGFTDFINQLNARVDYYNHLLAERKALAKKKAEEEEKKKAAEKKQKEAEEEQPTRN